MFAGILIYPLSLAGVAGVVVPEYHNRWTMGGCQERADVLPCLMVHGPGLCGGIYFYDIPSAQAYCNHRHMHPCDVNGDGVTNSQDFFDFLAAFFAEPESFGWFRAEWNGDGAINSQDYMEFMRDFSGVQP